MSNNGLDYARAKRVRELFRIMFGDDDSSDSEPEIKKIKKEDIENEGENKENEIEIVKKEKNKKKVTNRKKVIKKKENNSNKNNNNQSKIKKKRVKKTEKVNEELIEDDELPSLIIERAPPIKRHDSDDDEFENLLKYFAREETARPDEMYGTLGPTPGPSTAVDK